MTTNNKDICEMFNDSKAYAMEKNINKIILFAKGIENVLKFKNILDETDIELIITTFPSNQVLYIEDEEEGIIETHPEILSFENRTKLKSLNIPLITSTFPFEPIIIPGNNYNPYSTISQTLNIFGPGTDIAVQSSLMAVDTGVVEPGERILSLTTQNVLDLKATNSRFLFHPEKGLEIYHILRPKE